MQLSIAEPTMEQYEDILQNMIEHRIRQRLAAVAKDVPRDMIDGFERALTLEEEGELEEARELFIALIDRKNEIITNARADINTSIAREMELQSYYEEAERLYGDGEYLKAKKAYEKILLLRGRNE